MIKHKNDGSLAIFRAEGLTGEVNVPGDKSISHRSLLLGAMAEGTTTIENLAPGKDLRSTLDCVRKLGIGVKEKDGLITAHGKGIFGLEEPRETLDCGNSGTLARLVSGIIAGQKFSAKIDGDESLRARPMERIIEPLEAMGARIDSQNGGLPLAISGRQLDGITYSPEVASAQVKSCILLAGLAARGETVVEEVGPSRDHTERMLQAMGYPIKIEGRRICVQGPAPLEPLSVKVPGDFSSASFLLAGAIVVGGSKLKLKNVGLNETRTGFLKLLERMGARVEVSNFRRINEEPVGDLVAETSDLSGISLNESEVVKSIDELPLLAVVATQARGETEVRGAEELRVKETDRISATVQNLKEMGASIEEFPDGFVIQGKTDLKAGKLKSFGDHRIAMSMTVAGLLARGETTLVNPEWVEISYPGFYEEMERLIDEQN